MSDKCVISRGSGVLSEKTSMQEYVSNPREHIDQEKIVKKWLKSDFSPQKLVGKSHVLV